MDAISQDISIVFSSSTFCLSSPKQKETGSDESNNLVALRFNIVALPFKAPLRDYVCDAYELKRCKKRQQQQQ